MSKTNIPITERLNLTIREASQYSRIGENKLRRLIAENKNADWHFTNGTHTLIKRKQFEKFIDRLDAI